MVNPQPPPRLWESGNPALFAGFPSEAESRFLDFSASRLFHSPTPADFCFLQRHSFRTVMPQTLGAVRKGESSVQVLVHRHGASRQGRPPPHRLNLQRQVLNIHGVVPVDRALVLQCEDQVQILARAAHKRAATFLGRDLEAPIERGDVVLAQEAIGGFQRSDSV
jgi:hypothetical protein